uniref:Uncharacterized protein n=1 Tax=Romanomermis culicivorax TaxID=13658 RepID=A0A915K678_ROMCU
MARLMAHIGGLRAQQMGPAPRNLTPSTTLSVHIQNAGDHPSGAHLQMCSYHGRCTHNDASCRAQHPNSTGPSNATPTGANCCYFCQMRVHPTDRCDRPCLHCRQIRVHRARACPHRNLTMPAASVVLAPALSPALLPLPLKYVTPVTLHPSMMPKRTSDVSVIVSYRPTEGTLVPPTHFAAQGPPPRIPMDSGLEVISQMEWMNLLGCLEDPEKLSHLLGVSQPQ